MKGTPFPTALHLAPPFHEGSVPPAMHGPSMAPPRGSTGLPHMVHDLPPDPSAETLEHQNFWQMQHILMDAIRSTPHTHGPDVKADPHSSYITDSADIPTGSAPHGNAPANLNLSFLHPAPAQNVSPYHHAKGGKVGYAKGGRRVTLTPEQAEAARLAGVSYASYAKQVLQIEDLKRAQHVPLGNLGPTPPAGDW